MSQSLVKSRVRLFAWKKKKKTDHGIKKLRPKEMNENVYDVWDVCVYRIR